MAFVIIRNVKNKPGMGRQITGAISEMGVNIEAFNALSTPTEDRADVMIIVRNEDVKKVKDAVNRERKITEADKAVVVRGLTGIVIRGGASMRETPGVLERAFRVATDHGVNVIMAYTTLVSLNLFIESKDFTPEFMSALEREFK